MKNLVLITLLVFAFGTAFSQSAASRETKVKEFKVFGNCGMCKSRIEKAAKSEGVVSAVWDIKTKMLKVEYDPSKIDLETIHKNIAEVGHDTDKIKAADKVYNRLHSCCKYERE